MSPRQSCCERNALLRARSSSSFSSHSKLHTMWTASLPFNSDTCEAGQATVKYDIKTSHLSRLIPGEISSNGRLTSMTQRPHVDTTQSEDTPPDFMVFPLTSSIVHSHRRHQNMELWSKPKISTQNLFYIFGAFSHQESPLVPCKRGSRSDCLVRARVRWFVFNP